MKKKRKEIIGVAKFREELTHKILFYVSIFSSFYVFVSIFSKVLRKSLFEKWSNNLQSLVDVFLVKLTAIEFYWNDEDLFLSVCFSFGYITKEMNLGSTDCFHLSRKWKWKFSVCKVIDNQTQFFLIYYARDKNKRYFKCLFNSKFKNKLRKKVIRSNIKIPK